MVGNDIIDINETRRSSNWERPGFLQKIFTTKEQSFINTSVDPFTTAWQLWSMKESAYKVFIQKGGKRFFNPTKIECTLNSFKSGEVTIGGVTLKTESSIHSNYIFSTATFGNSNIETCIFELHQSETEQQSKFMYKHILNDFVRNNSLNRADLLIQKTTSGVPFLQYKNKLLKTSLSITHHGKYGAYSILKNEVL